MNVSDKELTKLCALAAKARDLKVELEISEIPGTNPKFIQIIGFINSIGMSGRLANELTLRDAVDSAAAKLGVKV